MRGARRVAATLRDEVEGDVLERARRQRRGGQDGTILAGFLCFYLYRLKILCLDNLLLATLFDGPLLPLQILLVLLIHVCLCDFCLTL